MAAEEYGALNAELAEPEELAAEVVLAYDGLSPTAKVEETEAGAKITVVDKHGTTTATVKNGKDGATGAPGAHIGPEAPTNGEKLWVDTDEAPEESETEGGTQIDVVAKAGQLLSVAEVDADGKPTKWQAVDLPKAETPDWNANEGEKGYIEGRTHYVDEKGIVHKLDNKFIDADWMATKQDGGAGKTVFIPEQTVSGGLWKNLQADLVEGDVYAVEVNGVLYKCKCLNDGDGTLYLGNGTLLGATGGNNEPFCIGWLTGTGGTFSSDGTLEAPIGIKVSNWQDVVYNKLPEEYLPENVVKGEGGKVSWDNVSDRPISGDVGELLFSHTATFATDNESKRVSANDLALTDGAEYWLEVNGDMVKCRCEGGGMMWKLYDADGNMPMKRGLGYIYIYGQTAGTYTYNLYEMAENIVLDPNYIPSNIARKSDIPEAGGAGVDVTASVGQTIIVEEVDASGKPTKWRAADYQPRTHWSGYDEVLPSTEMVFSEEEGGFIAEVDFVLVDGATYIFNRNGVERSVIAVALDENTTVAGNLSHIEAGEDNGLPFVAGTVDGMLFVVDTENAELTLSIRKEEVTPIPAQYLTNAFPYYIEVTGSGTDADPYVCNDTTANVNAIYASGRQLIVRLTVHQTGATGIDRFEYYLPLFQCIVAGSHFGYEFTAQPVYGTGVVYISLNPQEDGTFAVSNKAG